jgi:hypothetical protein
VADITTTFVLTIPSLTVLVGILLNQYGIGRLDKRVDKVKANFDARLLRLEERMDRMEAAAERRHEKVLEALAQIHLDMREFYRTLGQHEVRLNSLEKAAQGS